MICEHPDCTGKHNNTVPTKEKCPAFIERNRAAIRNAHHARKDKDGAYVQRRRERAAQQHRDNRQCVYDYYGWSCVCCGASDDLTIDHVAGGGKDHRLELFGRTDPGGAAWYGWLVSNGLPGGYQTLCRPCNASKQDGDTCRLSH